MAWTDMPLTAGDGWSAVAFFNQFFNAVRERVDVAGLAGNYPSANFRVDVASGDDIQDHAIYEEMQDALEAACVRFIRFSTFDISDVDPTVDVYEVSRQADANGWFYTWANVLVDAGLNASGWERRYPREISTLADAGTNGERARYTVDAQFYDRTGGAWVLSADQGTPADVITAYGQMQEGDYIGPWIFNELQDVCDVLRYRLAAVNHLTPAFSPDARIIEIELNGDGAAGLDNDATLATAQANALTEFDLLNAGAGDSAFASLRLSPITSEWRAVVEGSSFDLREIKAAGEGWADGVDVDYSVYLWAWDGGVAAHVFNAHGYSVVEETWNLFTTTTESYLTSSSITIQHGLTAWETAPPWPATPAGNDLAWHGFTIDTGTGEHWVVCLMDFAFTQLT